MKIIYNNVEDIIIFSTSNEVEFIDFAIKIRNENEDFDMSILGNSDAEEYIEEYCDNLELNDIEIISLKEYAEKIGYGETQGDLLPFNYLQAIQDFAEEDDLSIWDYPISEFNDVKEKSENFIAVQVGDEIRICEY